MGKAAIYNPYLDTLGGGERYTLTFAKTLADRGWDTYVEWRDISIKERLEERFGIDLSNVNFIPDIKKGNGYDLCFWVSDGSIPLLHSRKNILHFQVPFHDVDGRSLFNKMKLIRIDKIICNSRFTKSFIDKEFGVSSLVIYPPCDISKIKPKRKENIILYVGRFSELVQSKRQDVLIEIFKKFSKKHSDWKLILVGGSDVGGKEFLDSLKKESLGLNVEILEGVDYKSLVDLYGRSKFFWSASGFEVNEKNHPEMTEHFGITIVESLSGGVVPIVYDAGGAKEIVDNGINGFLWQKPNELIKHTEELISDGKLFREITKNGIDKAKLFSNEKFNQEVLAIL